MTDTRREALIDKAAQAIRDDHRSPFPAQDMAEEMAEAVLRSVGVIDQVGLLVDLTEPYGVSDSVRSTMPPGEAAMWRRLASTDPAFQRPLNPAELEDSPPPVVTLTDAELDLIECWTVPAHSCWEYTARRLVEALRAARAELGEMRDAYDQLKSDADAEVGRLRIKAGEEPIALCGMCAHPIHEGPCS